MRDIAGEAVRTTEIGARGVMKPDSTAGQSLADFQAVVLEADRLSAEGFISIILKHSESMTAARYVDRIAFTRLR